MFLVLIAFLIAAFSGSTNPIFIRFATTEIPPITFSALRFLIAAAVLIPIWQQDKERIPIKDFYKMLPYTLNMALYSIGIQFTSVTMGSVLYTLAPILSAILGYTFLKEKLSRAHIVGAIFAFLGTTILIHGSIETKDILSFGDPVGNFIVLLAVCAWGFYPIGAKSLSKSYKDITILFYTFAMAGVISLLISPIEWLIRPIVLQNISYVTLVSILGSAFIGTLIYYYCYQWLIKNTTVFIASLVLYIGVVTAAFYGSIFFGEHLTPKLIIGTLLVLIGIFYATSFQHIKNNIKSVLQ